MSIYTLENAWQQARERLAGLEAVYDPGTFRVLTDIGVGPGWRCLEIGGGGGSVASWLCAKVGPIGHVLATDVDPRFLKSLADDHPNLDARRHDIVSDDLPPAAFDLIHARMVLEHLPERDRALRRMAALIPGGWLVIEAIDFGSEAPDPAVDAATAARFVQSHVARTRFLADHGFDLAFARGVSRRLRALGLVDVATEGRSYTWWGNAAGANVWRLSFEQRRDSFIGDGYLDESAFAEIMAMLSDPSFAATSPTIMAAWGRRAADGLT